MLGDVVEAAVAVGPVIVVTDDETAVPRGGTWLPDPGGGLGVAVLAGLEGVEGHALVLNADLPAATPSAIETLASAGLALVEAADGTTNALSLPDPRAFAPLYGPGRAAPFRAHADLVVDTDQATPGQVLARVLDYVRRAGIRPSAT